MPADADPRMQFPIISTPDTSKQGILVQRVYKPLRCEHPFAESRGDGLILGQVHIGFVRLGPVFSSVNFKTILGNDKKIVPLNPPLKIIKEPVANYVILEVASYEDEGGEPLEEARRMLDLSLPWLRLSISEIIAEYLIGENVFENSSRGILPTVRGPHQKLPYGWEPAVVRSEDLEDIRAAFNAFHGLPTTEREPVELAMLLVQPGAVRRDPGGSVC